MVPIRCVLFKFFISIYILIYLNQKLGRKLLTQERPSIVCLPCFAHQVNLVVIDLFKGSPYARVAEAKMRAFVSFVNSHSRIAVMFEAKQEKPLVLIRPVMTR